MTHLSSFLKRWKAFLSPGERSVSRILRWTSRHNNFEWLNQIIRISLSVRVLSYVTLITFIISKSSSVKTIWNTALCIVLTSICNNKNGWLPLRTSSWVVWAVQANGVCNFIQTSNYSPIYRPILADWYVARCALRGCLNGIHNIISGGLFSSKQCNAILHRIRRLQRICCIRKGGEATLVGDSVKRVLTEDRVCQFFTVVWAIGLFPHTTYRTTL